MTEAQKIPWNQIVIEGVAIVISILLAFSIDAWWDGRKDRLEEKEILIGLEVEFTDLRDRLARWATTYRDGKQLIDQFLSDSMHEMDERALETVMIYAFAVNVLDQGGALDSLLASGRLERITDREIRSRLTKWPDWLEDIHTNDISSREFSALQVVPYLSRHGFPPRTCPIGDLFFSCDGPELARETYLQLARDPEFRAMLAFRDVWIRVTIRDYEDARDNADELLTLIRARLAEFEG